MTRWIFGLGCGRCGTHSLTKLLNMQNGKVKVQHEVGDSPYLPWVRSEPIFDSYISHVEQLGAGGDVLGDVSLYLLPYVQNIVRRFPGAPIVCLKRDKSACLASWKRWCADGRDHWVKDGEVRARADWDRCFPQTAGDTFEQRIESYYDGYYNIAEFYQRKYKNFRIFGTDDLNTFDGVSGLLQFCGFDAPMVDYFRESVCNSKEGR